MGQRTTTFCDACDADQAGQVIVQSGDVPEQPRGWGKLFYMHAETGYPSSYDLCSACVGKIVEHLALRAPDRGSVGMIVAAEPEPLLPPKTCEKCGSPYVGDGCYFCEPPGGEVGHGG